MRRRGGFTLIELMVTVALVAIILTLVAPSFTQYIQVQRLKGTANQVMTDLQLARSEAVSRGTYGRIVLKSNASMSCYTVFINLPGADVGARCDCTLGPGAACNSATSIEVRTVQVPATQGITLSTTAADPAVAFDFVTGGLVSIPTDFAGSPLSCFEIDTAVNPSMLLRTTLSAAGRPTMCAIGATLVDGALPACPATPTC